jgi:hypothetical protein
MATEISHYLVSQTRKYSDQISGFFATGREVKVWFDKVYKAFKGEQKKKAK